MTYSYNGIPNNNKRKLILLHRTQKSPTDIKSEESQTQITCWMIPFIQMYNINVKLVSGDANRSSGYLLEVLY